MRLKQILNNKIKEKYKYNTQNESCIPFLILSYQSVVNSSYSPNSKNFVTVDKQYTFDDLLKKNIAYNYYKTLDFEKIRDKQINLTIIGYGGFMINMMHFIELMRRKNTTGNIFKRISIYEDDKLSLLNSFRVYQDLLQTRNNTNNKMDLFQVNNGIAYSIDMRNRRFCKDDIEDNYIHIGSPDFETRKILENKNFLFFGHSNEDTIIHKSPVIDSDMAVETYGKMDIAIFFEAVLSSTIMFLYTLQNYDIEDIDHNTLISDINQVNGLNQFKLEKTKIQPSRNQDFDIGF